MPNYVCDYLNLMRVLFYFQAHHCLFLLHGVPVIHESLFLVWLFCHRILLVSFFIFEVGILRVLIISSEDSLKNFDF